MKNTAAIFKALGDTTRLEIVRMLFHKELCVCDILDAFSMSQPAISHHLRILREAGVVLDRKEGKWVLYRLNPAAAKKIHAFTENLLKESENIHFYTPLSSHQLEQEK